MLEIHIVHRVGQRGLNIRFESESWNSLNHVRRFDVWHGLKNSNSLNHVRRFDVWHGLKNSKTQTQIHVQN